MPATNITSQRGPEPMGAYPHARRIGNLLFVSGLGPRQRGQKDIPGVTRDSIGRVLEHDIVIQCRSAFQNLKWVIEDAGAKWDDLADVTVFLTNMNRDFSAYNEVYAEFFAGPGKPNPTRTTIGVTSLPSPIAVEIKAIVVLGNG